MNYEKLDVLSKKEFLKLTNIYDKQNVPDDYCPSFVEDVLNQKGELRIKANIVSNLLLRQIHQITAQFNIQPPTLTTRFLVQ